MDLEMMKFWFIIILPWLAVILLVFIKQLCECRPTMIRWQIMAIREIITMINGIR